MFLNADGRYHVVGTSYGPVFVFMPVTCRRSIEMDGRNNLGFGTEASFNQSYILF